MIAAYTRALAVLRKRPLRLWGLSLLAGIITVFAGLLTFPFLTLAGTCFSMVVAAGMARVYLNALAGEHVDSDQLFAGFKRFWPTLGGLAWRKLWLFIWSGLFGAAAFLFFLLSLLGNFAKDSFGTIYILEALNPIALVRNLLSEGPRGILLFLNNVTVAFSYASDAVLFGLSLAMVIVAAGSVFVYVKSLSYSFVEFILMTDESVSPTEALRRSVRMTRGRKGQIFLVRLAFWLAVVCVSLILAALASATGGAGIFFLVLLGLFLLAVLLFKNVFLGLCLASIFQSASNSGK